MDINIHIYVCVYIYIYIYIYIMDLVIGHSPPLFLAYGTSYRMTYGRSNPYIVLERN